MDTIRTKGKYGDYFLDNWDRVAKENNKFLYLGHYHVDKQKENFRMLGASCDGFYLEIEYKGGLICIEADVHLGIEEADPHIKNMIQRWKSKNYKKIILLGDFLEMQAFSDKDLHFMLHNYGIYSFLQEYKGEVILVKGNHDINLEDSYLLDLLKEFNNLTYCEYYYLDSMMFAHGHQYDSYIEDFGILKYYFIYKLGDYLNLPKKVLDKLVKFVKTYI